MLEVRTRRPMPINTDGEITTRTPARFEVIRKAISVCVPATYQPAEEVIADAAQ
jgi:diacylglycerol kinase family enzyme